nr:MAG TPA: hypothetical protein [Caudoviricetes sp.]
MNFKQRNDFAKSNTSYCTRQMISKKSVLLA